METFKKLAEVMSDLKLLDKRVNMKVDMFHFHYYIHLDVSGLEKEQIRTLIAYECLERIEANEDKVRLTFRIDK